MAVGHADVRAFPMRALEEPASKRKQKKQAVNRAKKKCSRKFTPLQQGFRILV